MLAVIQSLSRRSSQLQSQVRIFLATVRAQLDILIASNEGSTGFWRAAAGPAARGLLARVPRGCRDATAVVAHLVHRKIGRKFMTKST